MLACNNCSYGKRKCDRTLPSCNRCVKLNKKCIYPIMKPKYMQLESKISDIEMTYESIKDKFKNTGNSKVYNTLCAQYFLNFGACLPFIRYEKVQTLLLTSCQESALINAICIHPYQMELMSSFPNNKFPLENNHFYKKAQILLSGLLEDFSLETIQALLLMSFLECGAGLLSKSTLHLAQAVKKAHILNLDKAEFKRLTPDSDLQAEYIATWSACLFNDGLASEFFNCPIITNSPFENENTTKDLMNNSFKLPNFEVNGNICYTESYCEDFSSYLDGIINGLDLKFKHEESRFLLGTIAYKKASFLTMKSYEYSMKYVSKEIAYEQFSIIASNGINLLCKLTPKNFNTKFILSLSSINDIYIYYYVSLWSIVNLLCIYLIRNYQIKHNDPTTFDSRLKAIIYDFFTALNHTKKDFWKPFRFYTYFLSAVSLITVLYLSDIPDYQIEAYSSIMVKSIHNGLTLWPVLSNLVREKFRNNMDEARVFFSNIQNFESIQKYLT